MRYLARALATLFVWAAIFGCVWAINFGSQKYESPGMACFMPLIPAMMATMAIWWDAVEESTGCLGNYEVAEDDEDEQPESDDDEDES